MRAGDSGVWGLSNIATTTTGTGYNNSKTPQSLANDREVTGGRHGEFERTEGAAAARESSMERERARDQIRTTMRGSPAYNEQKAKMEGAGGREKDTQSADGGEPRGFLGKAKDKIIGAGA